MHAGHNYYLYLGFGQQNICNTLLQLALEVQSFNAFISKLFESNHKQGTNPFMMCT